MSAEFYAKGSPKHHPTRKAIDQTELSEVSDDFIQPYSEFAAEFEEPRNRRQAKKDSSLRKKRHQMDVFY